MWLVLVLKTEEAAPMEIGEVVGLVEEDREDTKLLVMLYILEL